MLLWAGVSSPASARGGDPALPSEADIPIAILIDASSGQVLHERNADRRFMPASITKVMTAMVAFDLLDEGKLEPVQRFRFRPQAFKQWGAVGSTMFINSGDSIRVADLLRGITTVSANDAAVVLAEGAAGSIGEWARVMNAKAAELGMTQSHFASPNGWPDEGRTFTSARDLVTLGSEMIRQHPGLYRRYFGHRRLRYRGITQPNHEPFTGQIDGGDGIKTGFTNEAGFGVLGSAERAGRRLVLVVAGVDRARVRDRAARAYLEWGYANFASKPLFKANETVAMVRVQGGDVRQVAIATNHPIAASIPHGARDAVELTLHYSGPVRAPISAGQRIAELEISVDGLEPSRVPLYAQEAVNKAGTVARLFNGLVGWFS